MLIMKQVPDISLINPVRKPPAYASLRVMVFNVSWSVSVSGIQTGTAFVVSYELLANSYNSGKYFITASTN